MMMLCNRSIWMKVIFSHPSTPVELNIDGDSIDLEIRVSEGSPANINRVLIKGNTKTNEHVIRREIRTVPGDLVQPNLYYPFS